MRLLRQQERGWASLIMLLANKDFRNANFDPWTLDSFSTSCLQERTQSAW